MSDYNTVDITDIKKLDLYTLKKEIEERVRDTQRFIVRPYPENVKMTVKQYNILSGWDENEPFIFDNKLYRTQFNVMNVEVVDAVRS